VKEVNAMELPELCSENTTDLKDLQHLMQPRIASGMQGLADTAFQLLRCCMGLHAHRAQLRFALAGFHDVDGESSPREGNRGA
jgi:hypothetical protein